MYTRDRGLLAHSYFINVVVAAVVVVVFAVAAKTGSSTFLDLNRNTEKCPDIKT